MKIKLKKVLLFCFIYILTLTVNTNIISFADNKNSIIIKESFYGVKTDDLKNFDKILKSLEIPTIWKNKNKAIGKADIKLNIDLEDAIFKSIIRNLNNSLKLLNGNSYIPFIALDKTLYYNNLNALTIYEKQSLDEKTPFKHYSSTKKYANDYLKMRIVENGIVEIKCKVNKEYKGLLVNIDYYNSKNKKGIITKRLNKSIGTYNTFIDLRKGLKNGKYKIEIYVANKINTIQKDNKIYKNTTYVGKFLKIPLVIKDRDVSFRVSEVYENNLKYFAKNSKLNPKDFLKTNLKKEKNIAKIKKLAKTITKNTKTNLEKAKKIHDWVSKNIYYDWDGFNKDDYGDNDTISVLKNRKCVCVGYANLVDELLKAVNIPSRKTVGFALGGGLNQKNWDEVKDRDKNHIWNEAYINGRWIIIDTTWDSSNRFENGKFQNGVLSYNYFDPSLEFFSNDHRMMELRK